MKRNFAAAFASYSKTSSDENVAALGHSLKMFPWMKSLLDKVKNNPVNCEILFCIESSGGKRSSWGYARREDLHTYINSLTERNRTVYELVLLSGFEGLIFVTRLVGIW